MIRWFRMLFYYVLDGIQEFDKLVVFNLGLSKIEYFFDESVDKVCICYFLLSYFRWILFFVLLFDIQLIVDFLCYGC